MEIFTMNNDIISINEAYYFWDNMIHMELDKIRIKYLWIAYDISKNEDKVWHKETLILLDYPVSVYDTLKIYNIKNIWTSQNKEYTFGEDPRKIWVLPGINKEDAIMLRLLHS